MKAPAKINLALHILGRRLDGYHEIDSLFLPIALYDDITVTVEPASRATVRCDCPGVSEGDGTTNLAARAAFCYLKRTATRAHVTIEIVKKIWVAAGLGGGSTDAAAVLTMLNDERARSQPGSELSSATLHEIARGLGADVPFFLDPGPRRARGIGDALSIVEGVPRLNLVLVNPGEPLSTAAVYQRLGLGVGETSAQSRPPIPDSLGGSLDQTRACLHNDLEAPAIAACPVIAEIKAAILVQGALAAGMSGSGATVFGLFESPELADRAAGRLSASLASISAGYAISTRTTAS